jgi:putative tricarboxylic transport membrane protein
VFIGLPTGDRVISSRFKEDDLNPIARNAKDFWTGVIYIAIGAAALFLSRDYGMGTAVKMGPAYFPTILSSLLILIGAISMVRSFLKPGTPISSFAMKGLVLVTFATLLFGFIVRGAGMAIALPLLIIISAYASTRFSWKYSLALAVGVTVFCILIFQVGLGVPLPILGSWFGY